MTTTTNNRKQVKITVPSLSVRTTWATLSDTPWDSDTLFEIVMRYCDAQDHARNYRVRTALKTKLLKSKLDELAKASGLTVEEYLEVESTNLAG